MKAEYKIKAHESFSIRKGWLHKGIKNILKDNRLFNKDKNTNPSDTLGLGTNMVKSLKYWLMATNLTEEATEKTKKIQRLTEFGKIVNQFDSYHEEAGTNYLIHYQLAKNESMSTAWHWFFNVYKGNTIDKERFVKEFSEYINIKYDSKPATSIVEDEFNCLMKTYFSKETNEIIDPEETKECPLAELNLIKMIDKKTREYKKITPDNDDVHPLIAFAIISEQSVGKGEILISSLLNDKNNIGKILNLDRITLLHTLEEMSKKKLITISRTAGLDTIKIKKEMTFLECLKVYYQELDKGEK